MRSTPLREASIQMQIHLFSGVSLGESISLYHFDDVLSSQTYVRHCYLLADFDTKLRSLFRSFDRES